MGFHIDLVAKSRKGRGLFRKGPDPRDVGERLGRLARRMLRDAVSRAGTKGDRYIVELACHPAAPRATLVVEPSTEIHLRADVAAVGPGYQLALVERIAPILDEIDYAWADVPDLANARAALCLHVVDEVRAAKGQVRIGLPDARRFCVDAPVLTPLGPRDDKWRVRLMADAAGAADAFAWWEVGPGREELSRALLAMSLEVPWREPLDADERELMTKVDEDLRAARKADPALALPWPEWKELLLHLGIDDEEVTAQAADRAPTLGYRRHDLEVDLSGGWRIVIPGAFVGRWDDDGAKYWATDGDRAIEFSSLTAPDEQDSAKLLAVAPERHPVLERIADADRTRRHGRAEAFEEDGVPIVIGLMTRAPHVGILTVKGGTQDWALATWRSLHHD